MLWVILISILKQESASLLMIKMPAPVATPESGLAQEGFLMTPTMRKRCFCKSRQWRQIHQSHGLHPGAVTEKQTHIKKKKKKKKKKITNLWMIFDVPMDRDKKYR